MTLFGPPDLLRSRTSPTSAAASARGGGATCASTVSCAAPVHCARRSRGGQAGGPRRHRLPGRSGARGVRDWIAQSQLRPGRRRPTATIGSSHRDGRCRYREQYDCGHAAAGASRRATRLPTRRSRILVRAPTGDRYQPADTEGLIMGAARRRHATCAPQRREPGREVDLIALAGRRGRRGVPHAALRPGRPVVPLGTVVTLSSPLRGRPWRAAADIDRTRSGADPLRHNLPLARTPAVRKPTPARPRIGWKRGRRRRG
jgi:hypothetical protein